MTHITGLRTAPFDTFPHWAVEAQSISAPAYMLCLVSLLPSALSLRVFPTPGTPGESGPFSPPSPQVSFWDLSSAILLAHPPGWREQTVRNSPPSAHCKLLLELNSRSLFDSFIQYLLGTFCGSGTVPGVGNSMVIMVLALMMLTVKGMKTGNKQVNK